MLAITSTLRFILLALALFYSATMPVQAQAKGELKLAMMQEPAGLDPVLNRSASAQRITYQNIFEGLTQINHSNQVIPSLAQSWKVDATGLTYTFKLRKNIFFHDNTRLTATIVKASLERLIALESKDPIQGKFANIKKIVAVSQHVVRIHLAWANSNFLYDLGLSDAVIQHRKSWENNKIAPIGTGPYRFVSWQAGQQMVLTANHHYWGKLANIRDIKIVFTQHRSQVANYLATGLVNGYSGITTVQPWNAFLAIREDYVLQIGNSSAEVIVAMNHANEMLASKEIRQAITHAINKKEMIDSPDLTAGSEIGSHYSPDDVAYLDLTSAYPFNITDAKMLVIKSGLAIKPLVLLVPPPNYAKTIGLHVQQMLREIGIRITLEELSWKEWVDRVYKEKDYDLTVIAHTEPHDLDIYARVNYYFNYESSEYQTIIAQIKRTLDEQEKNILLQKAQQMLSDDAVHVFLFMLPNVAIWDKNLTGYWVNEPIHALIFSQMDWQ